MTETERMHESGIYLHNPDDYQCKGETLKAFTVLSGLMHEKPKGGAIAELNLYRKYVPMILRFLLEQQRVLEDATDTIVRYRTDCEKKKNKRWTPEEEETLIELTCRDDMSCMDIATTLGRSVSAIKTKLSQLVGVKRLSASVVGRFFGKANGVDAELDLDGTVYYGDAPSGKGV